MSKRILRAIPFLLLPTVAFSVGCNSSGPAPPAVRGPIVCRIVATLISHPVLAEATRNQSGQDVMQDGRLVGQWLPIAPASLAADDIAKIPNVLTRQSDGNLEVLLASSEHDVTQAEMANLYEGGVDIDGRPLLTLTLTDSGSDAFFTLTSENANRHLAIVVGGKVRSVPKIQSAINDQFIIVSPTQAECDKIAAILKGA